MQRQSDIDDAFGREVRRKRTAASFVLLAVLFIPVLFPLLYSCVAATTAALGGVLDLGGAFGIGVVGAFGYDIIFTAIAWLLYDYVVG